MKRITSIWKYEGKGFIKNYRMWLEAYMKFINRKMDQQDMLIDSFEIHHIIPRSWGGTDEQSNLIKLSYQDHIIAHCYLAHTGDVKMLNAVMMFFGTRYQYFSPQMIKRVAHLKRQYSIVRGRRVVNLDKGIVFSSIREASMYQFGTDTSALRSSIFYCKPYIKDQCYYQYEDCITERSYQLEIEKIKRLRVEREKHTKQLINQRPQSSRARAVVNINTLQQYPSIKQAADENKVSSGSIMDAIKYHTSVHDCFWCFAEQYNEHLLEQYQQQLDQTSKKSCVEVVDVTNNITYPSVKAAADQMGVRKFAIISDIKNQGTCCGRRWKFLDDQYDPSARFSVKEVISNIVYRSKKEASKATGVSVSSIRRLIDTGRVFRGTLWSSVIDNTKAGV